VKKPKTHPERILVRGVNWLGDAVMSTPALLRLREAFPAAHIALLTPRKLEDLWTQHPAVNEVVVFSADEGVWSVGRKLRDGRYDLGLVLPNSPRSALELWLGGVSQRVGFARPWRNWLLTQRVPARSGAAPMRKRAPAEIRRLISGGGDPAPLPPPTAHQVYEYLHLAAAVGASPEPLPPLVESSVESVTQFARRFSLTGSGAPSLWFGLNAGAEYGPAKRWPEERFTDAAIEVLRQTRCGWLVFGLKNDFAMTARIAAAIQSAAEKEFGLAAAGRQPWAINLAGATSLGELCAALRFCRVLLTNDSGPMHVAAALGTPVVVPFGSTSPELTGPGLPGDARHQCLRAGAPCSPCFRRVCPIDLRCLTGISVDRVVEAVLRARDLPNPPTW
jgi:heptosyltransferase-2